MSYSNLTKLDPDYMEQDYQIGEDFFPVASKYTQLQEGESNSNDEVLTLRQKVLNFFRGMRESFVNAGSSAISMAGRMFSWKRNTPVDETLSQLSETNETKTKIEPKPSFLASVKKYFSDLLVRAGIYAPVTPVKMKSYEKV